MEYDNTKLIYIWYGMFKALFYPMEAKFYTDNVRASVTNSMSDYSTHSGLAVFESLLKLIPLS